MIDDIVSERAPVSRSRKLFWAAIVIVLLFAVAALHYYSGKHPNFFILFLVPSLVATYKLGLGPGLGLAIAGPALGLTADLTLELDTPKTVVIFNALLRAAVFVMIVVGAWRISRQSEVLRRMSYSDELTGLGNRRAFLQRGAEGLARARRSNQAWSLIFVDLDNFKQVNDRRGHKAGDQVLQRTARVILKSLRVTDFAARLGGDEFAVLLADTRDSGALLVAEKLRNQLVTELKSFNCNVTASVGVATFSASPKNFEQALAKADELMYEAKRGGKNGVRQREFNEEDWKQQTSDSEANRMGSLPTEV